MALRHLSADGQAWQAESSAVYRLAAMLSRLGKRGDSVQEEPDNYGIDFDSDFDPDPDFDFDKTNSQQTHGGNA